ncbi:drebrin-like protein isoform X2 [Wyeomyia smithii]|uniref:drebrin-like protein isoform X2 n=1 Tax=Wyeomyia smithii TaxID=174621 RepID=UPI002467FB4C|nr:drebrin-like protein isoform X2 [Wyeomyia smithii]
MSIDLDKNRDSIVRAWKSVVDTKSSTNWALFSYEGQSNVLKVQETGEDGIAELAAEFNSGKVQYGFVRVDNRETGIAKFVFINWQSEGAPTSRKGSCAKHVRDVCNLLKGAHITIHAANEDDVEEARIMEKLQKVVVNDFKVKDYSRVNDAPKPVGTNYNRVIPTKEINPAERDEFWRKEEEEEKHRLQLEYERKLSETMKLEEERRRREELEFEKREAALESPQSPAKADYARQVSDNSRTERDQDIKQVAEASGKVSSVKARFLNSTAPQVSPVQIQQQQQPVAPEPVLTPDYAKEELNLINELRAELEAEQNALNGKQAEMIQPPQEFFDPNATIDLSDEDAMLRARALYDYQAADDSEISFDPGDIITHIDQIDEGWWQGLAPDGTYGLFPANYVELI